MEKKEGKIFEDVKTTMFIKGGNTSMTVTQVLKELVSLVASLKFCQTCKILDVLMTLLLEHMCQ